MPPVCLRISLPPLNSEYLNKSLWKLVCVYHGALFEAVHLNGVLHKSFLLVSVSCVYPVSLLGNVSIKITAATNIQAATN
jgi:hypothetical protein